MALITGNTYPVRTQLKTMGGIWMPALQGWMVPNDKAEEAQALVTAQGTGQRQGRRTPRTCETCGRYINYGMYCGKCEFSR